MNTDRQGWAEVSLGEVCRIDAPIVDPRLPEYRDLPHVSGENIESGSGRLLAVQSASQDGMTSGKYLFDPGVVLYSKLRPYLRKVTVADFRGLCSADMYPVVFDHARVSLDYAKFLLLSGDFSEFAIEESARARMPKLNREELLRYEFTLPPLPEQERIAARLTEQLAAVDRARAAARDRVAAAEALPAAYLRDVFEGPDAEEWREVRFGDLVTSFDGMREPVRSGDRKPGPYPYYGASGIIDRVDRFLFDGDYLLIAEDGANLVARSTPIAFVARGQFWVNNHAHVVQPNNPALTDFLVHYFAWLDIADFVTGSAQPKLNQAVLHDLPVTLPDEVRAVSGRP